MVGMVESFKKLKNWRWAAYGVPPGVLVLGLLLTALLIAGRSSELDAQSKTLQESRAAKFDQRLSEVIPHMKTLGSEIEATLWGLSQATSAGVDPLEALKEVGRNGLIPVTGLVTYDASQVATVHRLAGPQQNQSAAFGDPEVSSGTSLLSIDSESEVLAIYVPRAGSNAPTIGLLIDLRVAVHNKLSIGNAPHGTTTILLPHGLRSNAAHGGIGDIEEMLLRHETTNKTAHEPSVAEHEAEIAAGEFTTDLSASILNSDWKFTFASAVQPNSSIGESSRLLLDGVALSILAAIAVALLQRSRRLAVKAQDDAELVKKESELRFEKGFVFSPIAALEIDSEFKIVKANEVAAKLLQETPDKLLGHSLPELIGGNRPQSVRRHTQRFLPFLQHEELLSSSESVYRLQDGTKIEVREAIAVLPATGDEEANLLLQIEDITEAKSLEAELHRKATHDDLTGLPNRTLFLEKLSAALEQPNTNVGVAFLDLDHFKAINDALGHSGGDTLLRTVAKRFTSSVRDYDVVARFGGDEFVVMFGDIEFTDQALMLSERLREGAKRPLQVGDDTIHPTLSVGVAAGVTGADPEELLRCADLALYASKANGRDRCSLYVPTMRQSMHSNYALDQQFRIALGDGGIVAENLPVLNLSRNLVAGEIVSSRWNAERAAVVPGQTVTAAALDLELSATFDLWELEQGLNNARAQGENEFLLLSMNARTLVGRGQEVLDRIQDFLDRHGPEAPTVLLELRGTQVDLLNNQCVSIRSKLQEVGVQPIGTDAVSASSLARMQADGFSMLHLTATVLHDDAKSSTIMLETTVALAEAMGLETIMSGIGAEKQLETAIAAGVSHVSGSAITSWVTASL